MSIASVTERRTSLALLPGIVDQPGKTLAHIMATPSRRWILPGLLSVIALVILLGISLPYLAEQADRQTALALQQAQAQVGDMTDSQRAEMEALIARFSGPLFLAGSSLAVGVLTLGISWLAGSAILLFGLQMSGHEVQLGEVFAGYTWTRLPFFLRDLVTAGWVLGTGKLVTNPGLSYFFSTGDLLADARNPVWALASSVDLFSLWHLLLVFQLTREARRRRGSVPLTIVYALLMLLPGLLLRVVPAALTGG